MGWTYFGGFNQGVLLSTLTVVGAVYIVADYSALNFVVFIWDGIGYCPEAGCTSAVRALNAGARASW